MIRLFLIYILEGLLADLLICNFVSHLEKVVIAKSNTNENKKGGMEGKFFSKNIMNFSNRVLTENEIRVLDKGLNFVPTPEKLDRYQIKKDLERLARNIKLRMYYKTEPTLAFS